MIQLFRHIRRSLINQNKMGKYFKYAIGEILLIVIGILIALGINNWNENRKAKNNEKALVKKLQEENNINLQTLSSDKDYRKELTQELEKFTDFLAEKNIEEHKQELLNYIFTILRSTSYTFSDTNLVNYLNTHNEEDSFLNQELITLLSYINDLEFISTKAVEYKLENIFTLMEDDVDFDYGKIHAYENLKSVKFRNRILLIANIEEEVTNTFDLALKQTKKVDSLFVKYLNN